MIKQILVRLVITLLVSAACGYSLSTILGFWQATALAFVLQIVLFGIYNNYTISKQTVDQEKLINERLDILSRNIVSFDCPCGNKVFEEVVYINDSNVFRCDKCEEDIKLEIALTPVVKTAQFDTESTYKKLQEITVTSKGSSL